MRTPEGTPAVIPGAGSPGTTGWSPDSLYRHLVESVVDYAIFVLDPDGRVRTWNAGAQRLKGYTADEMIGHSFTRFYTAADRAAGEPQRALATAAQNGRYEAEGWRVRKDGELFWALVVIIAAVFGWSLTANRCPSPVAASETGSHRGCCACRSGT